MGTRRLSRAGAVLTLVALATAGCSGSAARTATSTPPSASTPPPAAASSTQVSTTSTPAPSTPAISASRPPRRTTPAASRPTRSVSPKPRRTSSSASRGQRLPLSSTTGSASQVVTVTAPSTSSTQGTLQAWTRAGGGWRKHGPATAAWLGSDGLGNASESRSATPIGSFTLTQAFGHDADPGTALPYTQTTPADWWISQSGPLYNTRQRCSSGCGFTTGDPNEHLFYETPYYNYAVVIDYNTRNAPGGVQQGRGSAFFLHVTVGAPTQGCVSIAQDRLVDLLRWLRPSASPRILIGVA